MRVRGALPWQWHELPGHVLAVRCMLWISFGALIGMMLLHTFAFAETEAQWEAYLANWPSRVSMWPSCDRN